MHRRVAIIPSRLPFTYVGAPGVAPVHHGFDAASLVAGPARTDDVCSDSPVLKDEATAAQQVDDSRMVLTRPTSGRTLIRAGWFRLSSAREILGINCFGTGSEEGAHRASRARDCP